MELVRELLITVGISLLVSYVLAKLFSMASPSPSTTTPNNTVSSSSSSSPSPKEPVLIAKTPGQKPPRVGLADQAVELNQLEENPLSMAKTIGSKSICDDDEVTDNEVVLNRQNPDASSAVGWENRIISEGSSSILTESVKVGGVELADRVFDGIAETTGSREIEIESGKHGVNVGEGEGNKGDESDDGVAGGENCEEGGGEGAFGDWEGVERTELEKRFGDAVVFVGSKINADQISRLDSDVKMQLYGLHKVAIDGKCSVRSPMALKVSARAKWNAWQQLGDMSREVAMEQYISLLSRSIPGWTGYDAKGFSDEKSAPVPTVNVHNRHVTENESSLIELKPGDEGCGMTGSIQTP